MAKSTPRLGALLAVLLLGSLLLASPVFAIAILVDGNPADWTTGFQTIADSDEASIPNRLDISNAYYTNTTTNLFFRFDTVDTVLTTQWGGSVFAYICLNTDNDLATGGSIDQCEAGIGTTQDGVNYVARIARVLPPTPVTLGVQLYSCPDGATDVAFDCTDITSTGVAEAATATNVTEIRVNLPAIGITNGACSGQFTIPTSIYLDNGTGADDDNVPDAGEFTIVLPCPLPVTLESFKANESDGGVKLSWSTLSELNVAGYHLFRAASGRREEATQLTSTLIPATGDGVTGAAYSFTDSGTVAGASYSYWLQVVDADGTTDEYGPISVSTLNVGPRLTNRVYLPVVRR